MADANFLLVQLACHHTTAFLVLFQHSSMPTLITFMHGHSCVKTFLHYQKEPRKIHQNRLTHLCITVVNCLGNSLSQQIINEEECNFNHMTLIISYLVVQKIYLKQK